MAEKKNNPMDNAIDALIQSAASDIITEMFDEIDSSIKDEDIHFSKEHTQAMNKILNCQSADVINHFKLNKRFILVAIITMTLVIAAALSVGADRLKFLNYFVNISDIGTDFRKSPKTNEGVYYVDENLKESTNNTSEYKYSIKLNYIPDGFTLTDSSEYSSMHDATYYNINKYFYVAKSIVSDTISIDTENAQTEYIDINGNKAFLSIKPNQIIMVWENNDILYHINGNIDKETIIKIAENME